MDKPKLSIVLYEPDIPWNTGAIGRTCVANNLELILIHPIGFSLDHKQVRRAGMDYWQHVKLYEYENWQAFLDDRKPTESELAFFEEYGDAPHYEVDFHQVRYAVFGAETAGLPQQYVEKYPSRFFKLPMYSRHIRSLNLANTATAVIYEAIRQQCFK